MNLYEYQAKAIFADNKIPTPKGYVISKKNELFDAQKFINTQSFGVLKAQVPTGGRGKAGGVKVIDSIEQSFEAFGSMKGMRIKSFVVEKILVEEKLKIKREYFLSITIDPEVQLSVLLISPKGGIDIEEVARKFPKDLGRYVIDPSKGLPSYAILDLLKSQDFPKNDWRQLLNIIQNLYNAYNKCEATLIEINPLVVIEDNTLVAADGKLSIDDNAFFRLPEIVALKDKTKESILKENDIDYVDLGEGEVGLFCAGAGMTMLTMDLVHQLGSKPRCFMDVSQAVIKNNLDGLKAALEVLYTDSTVAFILVNMFGGLTRMDDVAKSLIKVLESIDNQFSKQIVMRIQGTNAEKGQKILKESGYDVYSELEDTMNCMKKMLENK